MYNIVIDDMHFENLTFDDVRQLSGAISGALNHPHVTPTNALIRDELRRLVRDIRRDEWRKDMHERTKH